MTYPYSFKDCLQRAERITWRVEDLIGEGRTLDFSKPFMPEGLARTSGLNFLTLDEQRTLNQIRGHAYLTLFGIIEEFILPFVLDHGRQHINGEDYRARAFLQFAAEEAKHIHLFRCFREEFARGFTTPCEVIGPPAAIGAHVLSFPPLSVALLVLHIEWMTQRHYLESVEDDRDLDPQFKSLLHHHWMEEHQHAHLDAMMVHEVAAGMSADELQAGFDGYLGLGQFFDDGLKQQAAFDLAALEASRGRPFNETEREAILGVQHQANRWTYLGSGMSHPRFLETLELLSPKMRQAVEAAAPDFS